MINIFKLSIIVLFLDSIFLYLGSNFFNKQINQVQNSNIKLNITGAIFAYILFLL